MQASRRGTAALLIVAAMAIGCGGGGDEGGSTGPAPAVLTTVEVSPGNVEIFSAAPANTIALTVVGKDQYGAVMGSGSSATFTSQNTATATVAADGTVTARAAGVVQVTASLTAGGVTKTGAATVTVTVASATASVTAPSLTFTPRIVDISAGGAVTWIVEDIHHNVTFTTAGGPAEIVELRNQSASRSFAASGTFNYNCSFHEGMTGVVRVH